MGLSWIRQPRPCFAEVNDRLSGGLRSDRIEDALVESLDEVLYFHRVLLFVGAPKFIRTLDIA
jgi:hypothetical protein